MRNVMKQFAGIQRAAVLAAVAVGGVVAGGCTRTVPAFSQLVAEAPSKTASFQAPDDGTVYVEGPGLGYSTSHLAYSGLIRRGEVLTVDPMAGKLLVNGKAIDATIDSGKVYYQVWYHPAHNELLGY